MRISKPVCLGLPLLAIALGRPAPSRAQGFGLDLTEGSSAPKAEAKETAKAPPAPLGLDLTAEGARAGPPGHDAPSEGKDLKVGPPVAAIPLSVPAGQANADAFHLLFAALQERLGARLVPEEQVRRAMDRVASEADLDARRIAEGEGAELAIAFEASGDRLWARVYGRSGGGSAPEASIVRPERLDAAQAKELVARLLDAAESALAAPPPPAQGVAELAAQPLVPAAEGPVEPEVAAPYEGIEEELARPAPPRRVAPVAFAVAGPGAVFRSLRAESDSGSVPKTQGVMSGIGVDVSFFPARLDPVGASGALSDLFIEGHYRRTFARVQVQNGTGAETSCGVDDDEVLARLAYRYALPGAHLPRVGLSAGWTSERVLVRCAVSALSTRLRTVDLSLTALEPILGEFLQIEASGGPRFVISPHSEQVPARSFSLELWVATHPKWWLYARAGARYANTRQATEQGVAVAEQRAFVGLELGASY